MLHRYCRQVRERRLGFDSHFNADADGFQIRRLGANVVLQALRDPSGRAVVGQFDCGRVTHWKTDGQRRIFAECEPILPSCCRRPF